MTTTMNYQKIYSLITLVGLAGMVVSCEETVQLDLKQTPSRIVIEGQVTNALGSQYVRVTSSDGFYQSGQTTRVTNAQVTVSDDTGEVTSFIHNPRGVTDSTGYYLPPNGFIGQVGRTYTLKVVVDGKTYEASDKLNRMTPLDSLGYRPNAIRERDKPSDGKTYELLLWAKEPQDTEDYYLVKYYRNDSLVYTNDTDVYILNDYGVGENINGFPSSVYYSIGDRARWEMYNVSRKAFLFYSDLSTILNSDGGMFSPPPANPRSNFSGGALGFFQVSGVTHIDVTLKDPN